VYQTYNPSSVPANQINQINFYWQNTTPSTSTNTLLVGAFYCSTVTPQPSSAPTNSCSFSLQFADPSQAISAGVSLANTGTYALSNFTLASGPLVNLSVYDFSVTAVFGSTPYTLLGTSSCLAMRQCSDCKGTILNTTSNCSAIKINDFNCSGNSSFTVTTSESTGYVSNSPNCSTPEIINSGYYGISDHPILSGYGHLNGYGNGSSIFINKKYTSVQETIAITHTVSTQCQDCNKFYIKFKAIWLGRYILGDNNVINYPPLVGAAVNGVYPVNTYTSTVINSNWIEYTAGPFTNNYPTTNTISVGAIFPYPGNGYLGIDDIRMEFICGEKAGLPCVNQESYDPFPTVEYEDPCLQYADDIVDNDAQELYSTYIDSVKTAFVQGYIKKCMGETIENFYMKYNAGDYHYTLYYYDQAGNLVRTVPPEGVKVETIATNYVLIKNDRNTKAPYGSKSYYTDHKLQTTYTYNSLNQLVKQQTPDAGISYFWYDKLGRLIASQNAKQYAKVVTVLGVPHKTYSYTKYDDLGRISEVGEMTVPYNFVTEPIANLKLLLNPSTNNYPSNLSPNKKSEVTRTYYGDEPSFTPLLAGSNFSSGSQEYLRSRVASVSIEDVDDNNPLTYNHATHYSYDVHGNVKELIQENPWLALSFANQKYKKINYNYDLISGKVNEVAYQPGQPDMFLHKYEYDADNRITAVYTSKDNVIWDRDAKYF
ncbi:MAG: hypothetical protein JNM51_08925, partial [Bacteroidia bacterium]|nr:hypothetical protein [Bacteroidia bacterium]